MITREQGKPLAEAHIEIERSADVLEWGGEQARPIAANDRRVEAIDRLVEDARQRGATILAGGHKLGNCGYFYAPPSAPIGRASLGARE